MAALLISLFILIGLVMFGTMLYKAFVRLPRMIKNDKPVPMEFYLFKISRVTGNSEYDIFCKSAEDWPVSKAKIDQDFTTYLQSQDVPYYVNDFVRKNQKHIDELHIPRF
jgi:hypothetical protein